MWDNWAYFGGPILRLTAYEAACLLAFALAALLAALFLVGQSVARYTTAEVADLQVLQAVGLTPRRPSRRPRRAVPGGGGRGDARCRDGHRGLQVDADRRHVVCQPHPGTGADWLILGPGWVLGPLLVATGSAAVAALALTARRRQAIPRRSAVAAAAAAAGLPVPVVVGARLALEPGRGRSAVPVGPGGWRDPGVLGVLAAFTFLGRGLRRHRQPGALRTDLAAGHVLRASAARVTAGRAGPAGRRRRSGRHRRGRRVYRRAVRPVLGRATASTRSPQEGPGRCRRAHARLRTRSSWRR